MGPDPNPLAGSLAGGDLDPGRQGVTLHALAQAHHLQSQKSSLSGVSRAGECGAYYFPSHFHFGCQTARSDSPQYQQGGRGRARILTKIAHSVAKPLEKRLDETGKSERNEKKCRMNCTKYSSKRLSLGHKRSKLGGFLEKKFSMSYFRQDPSPTSPSLGICSAYSTRVIPTLPRPWIASRIPTKLLLPRTSSMSAFILSITPKAVIGEGSPLPPSSIGVPTAQEVMSFTWALSLGLIPTTFLMQNQETSLGK